MMTELRTAAAEAINDVFTPVLNHLERICDVVLKAHSAAKHGLAAEDQVMALYTLKLN